MIKVTNLKYRLSSHEWNRINLYVITYNITFKFYTVLI